MSEEVQVLDVIIPKSVSNLELPAPELVQFYKDYDNRNIFISDIDEDLFATTKLIYDYNATDKGKPIEERKPITIQIMSYGGDLYQAYALISAMLASTTPVITINCGVAMSAGLLILLAGHKRYAMKYSTAMIHSGSGGAQGTYEQMEEQQKNYKKLVDLMRNYIMERTTIDSKLFNKNKTKDWYITDSEQVELGIVGKIVENLDEII